MGEKSSVKVRFLGDASALAAAARKAQGSIDGVGDKAKRGGVSLGGLGKAFVGAAAAMGAVSMFKGFIAEAEESRKIGRLTAQVIKTTGGAAKVTAGQVNALATAISNKTGVDDEAVQSASNLLLTFTGVRNEVGKGNDIFNQATQSAVDMAAVLGGDASSKAIMLGKALNDPVKGITALTRAGVSFTAQQKKQIAALVKSGDTLGAQKIILKELGKEFGGAAAAAATPTQKLGVIFGNLKERIGTALLPVVDKLATFLGSRLIPAVSSLSGPLRQVGLVFRAFWWSIREGDVTSDGFIGRVEQVGAALFRLGGWINSTALPALRQIGGFLAATFAPTVRAMGDYFHNTLLPAWEGLAVRVKENIGPIVKLVAVIAFLAAKILGVLMPILIRLTGFLVGTLFAAIGLVIGIVGGLVRAFIWVGETLGETAYKVTLFVSKVVDAVTGLPGRIKSAASGMWDGIKDSFRSVINWIIGKWNDLSFTVGGGSVFGKDLPSVTLGTPNIPMLAKGGVVTRPTLAMIGEAGPEAVVPLGRGGGLGRGRGGDTYYIDARGAQMGAAAEIVRELKRYKRELGGNLGLA